FSGDKSREYFKDNLINKYTLKFFKYLQETFKDMTYDQHIEAVRKYLYDSMDSESADKLLVIYKKFLDYENRIAAEISGIKDLETTDDFLNILLKMKKMQIEIFGEKDADIIFGASLKSQEYPIRRAGIVNDKSLYGKEKEERISKLNKEMWGSEGEELEKNRKPYTQYTEKIETYSKDLSEMTESDKLKKIKEFRAQVFSPDIVQRLEEVDSLMEAEKQKELSYLSAYSEITNNKDLNEKEKKEMIYNLQNKTFGEEADSVRRRTEMEAGKNDLIKKYKAN
ncbi:MAG TPA: lipase secretion chaperone, partial [Spirochaetota bacterium]|nr:lipase secretion chaperone [Spirochaetota bacterium]